MINKAALISGAFCRRPFGMGMVGREFSQGYASYRYSINGQEKETEVNKNITTAEYWEYDSRIGRRWNTDPVVKIYESPYLCFGGNPILVADPNGLDSVLANGSKTWTWKIEKNDTYKTISKRTGVSLNDLKKWNGYKGKSNTALDNVNSILNISDPATNTNSGAPKIVLPMQGEISVNIYRGSANPQQIAAQIYLAFCPNKSEEKNNYTWYQTFETNAPISANLLGPLRDGDDGIAGVGSANRITPLKEGEKYASWLPEGPMPLTSTEVGHYDIPNRQVASNGTVGWYGTVSLLKKVNDSYTIIATFQYSFTVHSDGSKNLNYLEFNPQIDKNSKGYQNHITSINKWQEPKK